MKVHVSKVPIGGTVRRSNFSFISNVPLSSNSFPGIGICPVLVQDILKQPEKSERGGNTRYQYLTLKVTRN